MKEHQQQSESEIPVLPWFRYGMVWMIILLPLAAVVASLITLAIAKKHAPTILPQASAPSQAATSANRETATEKAGHP